MEIKEILDNYNNIAVVGMSKHLEKPAFTVPSYMKKQGYKIIPVNPTIDTIMKLPSYKSLMDVPDFIEIVLVFRPSTEALDIVNQAIERKRLKNDVNAIWLQLGIINNEAKSIAEKEGIHFVQDKCMYVEHKNYL